MDGKILKPAKDAEIQLKNGKDYRHSCEPMTSIFEFLHRKKKYTAEELEEIEINYQYKRIRCTSIDSVFWHIASLVFDTQQDIETMTTKEKLIYICKFIVRSRKDGFSDKDTLKFFRHTIVPEWVVKKVLEEAETYFDDAVIDEI